MKVIADADGRSIAGIKIIVNGPFESITLFNDGLHDDNAFNDNVFAAIGRINDSIEEGDYNLFFSTSFRGVDGNATSAITVFPFINVDAIVPEEIELGNNLHIEGIFSIDSKPVKVNSGFLLNNLFNEVIVSENSESNEEGEFSFSYRSTFLDKPGEWIFSISGEDEHKNTVKFERTINVFAQGKTPKREIEFLKSIKENYSNGDEIEILIRITQESLPVENASVVVSAGKNTLELTERENGEYAGTIVFAQEKFLENSFLKVQATNESGATIISDEFSFKVSVGKFKMEILEPEKKVFGAGEKISVKAIVTDLENSLVSDAKVYALLNNKRLDLELESAGIYSAEYLVEESDEGSIELLIGAENRFAKGEVTKTVFVSGQSMFTSIEENLWPLLFGLLIVAGTGYFLMPKYREYNVKDKKKNKLRELDSLEKEAQGRYFHKKTINKKEYNELMEKYKKERREAEL